MADAQVIAQRYPMDPASAKKFTSLLRSNGYPFRLNYRWSDLKEGKTVITVWRQLLQRNAETGALTYYVPPRHTYHRHPDFMKVLHEHVRTAMERGWPIVGVVQETEGNVPIAFVGEQGRKRGLFCTQRFPLLHAAFQPDGALILSVVGDADDIV